MKRTIAVTQEQAEVIAKALDLYVRIGTGQFDEAIRVFDPDRKLALRDRVEALLKISKYEAAVRVVPMASIQVRPQEGPIHPIDSPEVREEFRIAHELQEVVRCLGENSDPEE